MEKSISKGLKTTFLLHAIVAIVLGLSYLLIPGTVGSLMNWDTSDPAYRLVGAAITAFGVSSWLAYQASNWKQVKIVVQMELVWTVLGALVALWGLVAGVFPLAGWLNFVILAGFAIAFGYFYRRS